MKIINKYLLLCLFLGNSITAFSQTTSDIGVNLASVHDWSSSWYFVDRMKQARPWGIHDIGTGSVEITSIPDHLVDTNGYPTQVPFDPDGTGPLGLQEVDTLIFRDTPYPAGRYALIFDGEGTIRLDFDASGVFSQPNTVHYFNVNSPSLSGIRVTITNSSPGNHVRNIRILMPGFENNYAEQVFHPLFLERLKGFKILRFMDWGMTNNSEVVSWDQRTKFDYYTQARDEGTSYEYMIMLSNRLGIDPWICVPHKADDNYIQNLATLIRDQLNPDRKVYIEYSNELWNWGFQQTSYMEEQRINLGYSLLAHYIAKRSAEIFDIFESIVGDSRTVNVIASQAANSWISDQILLGLEDPSINPSGIKAETLAIAPYFGYSIAQEIVDNGEVNSITIDEILDRAQAKVETETAVWTRDNFKIAQKFNIPLIAYEGGQHLAAGGGNENNQTLTAKLIGANRHYRMKDIYVRMYEVWFENGGTSFCAYEFCSTLSKWGSWGMLEYQNQPLSSAPKFSATIQVMSGDMNYTIDPLPPKNIRIR